jgi:hypothetical protein
MKAATPPAGGVISEAAGGLEMVLKALFSAHGELPERRLSERKNYDRLAIATRRAETLMHGFL